MISDDFDISGFSLKEDEFVPTTGIKINLNVKDSIENKSAFRFVDATASKNANLDNLIVSSGTTDDCEQIVKENYCYKVNRELGNLWLKRVKSMYITIYRLNSFSESEKYKR